MSPELENVSNDGGDIDAVIDEGDNGSNTDSGETKGNPSGNVVLPSPFEDTSKNDGLQSIDLLVPGATQLIKWDVIENMLYADIYLYKEGNLYKEIVIGIENIGEYEWVSSESLETGHYYEVVVSQYTNQRPDDPYKEGCISAEFSMYPSAVNSAQLFVDTFHECLSEQEKKNYFIAYYKIFAESGVEFMEEVKGKGDSDGGEIIYDDTWINHPIKRWLLEQANEADSVEAFLAALGYFDWINYLDDILKLLEDYFGFTVSGDITTGNIRTITLINDNGKTITIIFNYEWNNQGYPNIIITIGDFEIKFEIVVGHLGIQVFKYINGVLDSSEWVEGPYYSLLHYVIYNQQ